MDVILVGKFSQTSSGEYWATWQYYYRDGSRVYDSRTEEIKELGQLGLAPLADALASRYAIVARDEASPEIYLRVSGVSGFGKYRQALDYLEGLAVISDVVLLAVRQDTLLLGLKSESNITRFKNTLQLDKKLEPVDAPQVFSTLAFGQTYEGTADNPLRYRWAVR